MRALIGSIIKSNELFKFIKNHDKIMVGVSGGKDSTLLFYALTLYAKMMKEKNNWDIKVYGYHVKINFYENKYDDYLKWMSDHGLEVKIIESNVADILKAKAKNNKVICSLCAKMKKAILVKEAKKLKCNKIAMAHHIDDAIETLFLNMIYEGRIATFSPNMYMDRSKIWLIRPFVLVSEKEIIRTKNRLQVPIITNACPNETTTKRTYLNYFLEQNFHENKNFNNCYNNFKNSLINGKQSYLWFNSNKNTNKDFLKIINYGKLSQIKKIKK